MEIGNSLTVRCGCFEKYVNAQHALVPLKREYKIAIIATTYKYRFDNTIVEKSVLQKKNMGVSTKKSVGDKIKDEKDEELRLIFQVFLYKGNLEDAYKTATVGLKNYPNSYYWNQKMSEVTRWTNRLDESMKYLHVMYNIRKDPIIEAELIKYARDTYKYEDIEPLVLNKVMRNPTEKNIDLMIHVYKQIGTPEKILTVLDKIDHSNNLVLTKALSLSLEMGDLNIAKNYVDILEKTKPFSVENSILLSKYYYITHDMKKAYKSLENVDFTQATESKEHMLYYELKSDLGWYLQDNETAAEASKYLIEYGKARLVDYERVSFVYQKKDPQLTLKVSKEAYLKYKHSYLFYSYANGAIKGKNYKELSELLTNMEESKSPLIQESLYWLIKSKVYRYYSDVENEKYALMNAYELEPNNMQIKLELLWFYMSIKETNSIKMILDSMSESDKLPESVYFPMASGYFILGDINRASYYTQKLIALNNPVIELLEFKFLQAYIYQIQNNEYSFNYYMQNIVQSLKHDAQENPKLKTDDEYLSNYLRAAMYVLNPDKFEKKLKKAKPYLKRVNYDEISYSWAIKNNAYEKSRKIYYKMKKRALWVDFSDALIAQEHTRIENLLEFYLYNLSMGDASQATEKDGQISLSQTITYNILDMNEKNQNAYIQHVDLSKKRSDKLDSKISYYHREPLLQKYITVQNSSYLQNDYYMYAQFGYYHNESINNIQLINVPKESIKIGTGFKKIYNRGYIKGLVNYHNSMDNYMEFSLEGKYRISSDIKVGMKIGDNIDALESLPLYLGGKKDMISLDLDWQLLNSTNIELQCQNSQYSSQDNIGVGDGQYARMSIIQQIRNGYPDLKIGAFYDRGLYNEKNTNEGIVYTLNREELKVLPNDFYNAGVTLSYGMANSQIYTRVWRPYIEFYPYYNSDIDDYTFGAIAGYGGKIFHQDHLSIGASYTGTVNGIGGSIFEIFLNYQFMYYHP
jgi:hypothetical protein